MASLEKLQALSIAKNLGHAWLLVDVHIDALLKLAETFSQWLLCTNKQGNAACYKCRECTLFIAGTNPDFCLITPQADKASILVEDIRALSNFTVTKPQFSQQKIVLLYPAEAMHKQSSNALLKNLEEPCSNTIFLLLTKHPNLLLKTVVSRCQILHFGLQLTTHMLTDKKNIIQQIYIDLEAIWVKKNVTSVQIVDSWLKQWPNDVLYCLELVITDIITLKYTQSPALARNFCAELVEIAVKILPSKIWAVLSKLRQVQLWLASNNKPNMHLVLEDILASR